MTVRVEIWDEQPDRIKVEAPFRYKDRVKTVPGRRWDNEGKTWHVPLSWAACKQLRGTFGEELSIGPNLADWARAIHAERVERALELREPGTVVEDWDGDERLYEFQRVGVEFLTVVRRAMLADDMGLGKTVQTIEAMRQTVDLSKGPVLVIAPNSMTRTWKNEIRTWWGEDVKVEIVSGSDPVTGPVELGDLPGVGPATVRSMEADADIIDIETLRERLDAGLDLTSVEGIGVVGAQKIIEALDHEMADVYIVNWDSLRLHTRVAGYGSVSLTDAEKEPKDFNRISWQAVVADEAHNAKSPKAKRSRALWWIGRDVPFKVALTGTPIADTPVDAWSPMHFLAEEEYPTRTHFIDRYVDANLNIWGGMDFGGLKHSNKDEFYEVFDPRFLRRTKEQELDLPEKTESIREVDMEPQQAKAYSQMEASMVSVLDDGGVVVAPNPLTQMLRLSQFAAAYAEVDEENKVTLSTPSCKVNAMMDIMDEVGDDPVVFFAESKQLIMLCAEALDDAKVTYGMITGDVSADDRQQYVEEFQKADGKRQVMLATVGAGGEGITLTAATTLVFLQRSWSMIKNKQAADRIYRIGQEQPVQIIDVVATGTMEHYRLLKLAGKHERLQEITRDNERLAALYPDDDSA